MKNTKVMIAETAEKVQLSIPLNSSLMVGIIYDPNDNLEEARRGLKVGLWDEGGICIVCIRQEGE